MPKIVFNNNDNSFFTSLKADVDTYFQDNKIAKVGDQRLFIKKSSTDWPFQNGLAGLLLISNKYPRPKEEENKYGKGFFIYTLSFHDLENALIRLKPILDEIKNQIIPHLIKDDIEFDIK